MDIDLVDIDQVLDNLEMREAAKEKQQEKDQNLLTQSHTPQNPVDNINKNNTDIVGGDKDIKLEDNKHEQEMTDAASINARTKTFVGVSQVLSSLDDYCEDVKTLEAGMLRFASSTNPQPIKKENEKHEDNNTTDCTLTIDDEEYDDAIDDNLDDDDDDDHDEYDDDDYDEEGMEIHRFVGDDHHRPHFNDDSQKSDQGNLSNSLTTSSSSTFSSGPSLGLISTEVGSSPITDDDGQFPRLIERSDKSQTLEAAITNDNGMAQQSMSLTDDLRQSLLLPPPVTADAPPATINSIPIPSDIVDLDATINTTTEKLEDEDLAIGLSSISIGFNPGSTISSGLGIGSSISSIQPQMQAATQNLHQFPNSSSTDNKYELSTNQSIPKKTVNKNVDISSSTENSSDNVEDDNDVHDYDEYYVPENYGKKYKSTICTNGEQIAEKRSKLQLKENGPVVVAPKYKQLDRLQQEQHKQQPITFGSTMDEISDTELDSMLQEIDADEPSTNPTIPSAITHEKFPTHYSIADHNYHRPDRNDAEVAAISIAGEKIGGAARTYRTCHNVTQMINSEKLTQAPIVECPTIDRSGNTASTSAAAAAAEAAAAVAPAIECKANDLPPQNLPSPVVPLPNYRARRHLMPPSGINEETGSFIPSEENALPPVVLARGNSPTEFDYRNVPNTFELIQRLQDETLKFALQKNLFVFVTISQLKCCVNKTVLCFTTLGMHHVGCDEIVILLNIEEEVKKEPSVCHPVPKDVLETLYHIYCESVRGRPCKELGYTLGLNNEAAFIYIRPSYQCLLHIKLPENPFLIGLLIQKSEIPWAKTFPLRLILRLGAQSRYYPCPHVSTREREAVYIGIGPTIINFLADLRNFTFTLPFIKGLYIHMENRCTTVLIPRNRHDQIIQAINNSSDHILAFGGNFSKDADGHLVCIQHLNPENPDHAYTTQAINIQGKPREVTGVSFFVLNEALKNNCGLKGKCHVIEDGLMVQILSSKMEKARTALRNQKNFEIMCGPIDGIGDKNELIRIKWVGDDEDFNVGVASLIDGKSMKGVLSIRVHSGFSYSNGNYAIRWTEVFLIKSYKSNKTKYLPNGKDRVDISKISEQIAKSTSIALLPFLDLLVTSGNTKLNLRAHLNQENVCYEAGARHGRLPPLYMNALDDQLVQTLHKEATYVDQTVILELVFHILNA